MDEFNWALDYFDRIAAGNTRPALQVLNENGAETILSFADLSSRSNQRSPLSAPPGRRRAAIAILLMLGNEVPLWETVLAAFKLGAVIIPTSTLLDTEDLRDRLERGHVRHVVAGAQHCAQFAPLEGSYTRIAVGDANARVASFDRTLTRSRNRSNPTA